MDSTLYFLAAVLLVFVIIGVVMIFNFFKKNKFCDACGDNNFDLVKKMLSNGFNPNTYPRNSTYPLLCAVRDGNTEIVKYLLDNGADIDVRHIDTPLTQAADAYVEDEEQIIQTMKLLIQKGADLNKKKDWFDEQVTPLMLAAENGYVKRAKVLLEAGADFNITDQDGATAKIIAESNEHPEVVELINTYLGESSTPMVEDSISNIEPTPESEHPIAQSQETEVPMEDDSDKGMVNRFRVERIAFIFTCAAIAAAIPYFTTQDLEAALMAPAMVTFGIVLTYAVCKMFFGTIFLQDTFSKAMIPEWAQKSFSFKQYISEFLIFIGLFLGACVLAAIFKLVTGR